MSTFNEEEIKNEARENFNKNDYDKAEGLFARVLLNNSNCIESLSCLGVINMHKNRFDFAKHFFLKAVEIEKDNHILHYNLGVVNQQLNNEDEAIKYYKQSIVIKKNVMSYNNLAFIYWRKREYEKAIDILKECTRFEENLSVIANLSNFLLIIGKNIEAIEYSSLALQPNQRFSLSPLVTFCNALNRLKENEYPKNNAHIIKTLQYILDTGSERPILNTNFIKLVFKDFYNEKIFKENNLEKNIELNTKVISNLVDNNSLIFKNDDFINLLTSKVISSYITKNVISNKYLENIFVKLRKFFLKEISENNLSKDLDNFLCSLAIQCEFNGYIWSIDKEEEKLINNIKGLSQEKLSFSKSIILSCYENIAENQKVVKIIKDNENKSSQVKEILKIQLELPKILEKEASKIKSLDQIKDKVSIKVRTQYENFPYPLWKSHFFKDSAQFNTRIDYTAERLKKLDRSENKQILVAGCGTGREAIGMAAIYKNSKIYAIDLSLKSLAYGLMKAKEDGINNVEFIHSDILNLKLLENEFDIISCCGVLHHMKDPSAGLKNLNSLLKNDGVMKIALYSSYARKNVALIKKYIHKNKISNNIEDIRDLRNLIKKKKIAISDADQEDIEKSLDFYSINELRDLLFHPQEINYNLKEIKELLTQCGLSFLEFDNVYSNLKNHYKSLFPQDIKMNNLDNWDQLEKQQEKIFSAMYVFWAEKNYEKKY